MTAKEITHKRRKAVERSVRRSGSEKVLFLASPGGLQSERCVVVAEVRRLNTWSRLGGLPPIRVFRWPEDIAAQLGADPQYVTNSQIPPYEFFVGIIADRLGTPTPRANSGTEEEFDRAIDCIRDGRDVEILLFFSNKPVRIGELDPHQLMLVHYFRQRAQALGVLFHTYHDDAEFRSLVRKSLKAAYLKHCRTAAIPRDVSRDELQTSAIPFAPSIVFRDNHGHPQWVDYRVIPVVGTRHRAITVTGTVSSDSPYFRFGFKYGEAREPVISAGSVQTFGRNILVHIGKNVDSSFWFMTSYQSGIRTGLNVPLSELDTSRPIEFGLEVCRDGHVTFALGAQKLVDRFFEVDGLSRIVLLAWGDEYEFECSVANLIVTAID